MKDTIEQRVKKAQRMMDEARDAIAALETEQLNLRDELRAVRNEIDSEIAALEEKKKPHYCRIEAAEQVLAEAKNLASRQLSLPF